MKKILGIACAIQLATLLAACAASPETFSARGQELGDTRVCRTWFKATQGNDLELLQATSEEVNRRGLSWSRCQQLINRQRVAIGAAIIVTAALVATASSDGGTGGGGESASPGQDSQWAWDQFLAERGQMMTRCRGVQTGRFAEDWRCAGRYVNDLTWPGPHFR